MRTFGSFWLARMWQGKVIFVAVLVPLLLALLLEHAERPSRRGVVLLVAAGVAAVGLTTTAMFVVPVLAAGCWRRSCARPGGRPRRLAGDGRLPAGGGSVHARRGRAQPAGLHRRRGGPAGPGARRPRARGLAFIAVAACSRGRR